MPPEPSTPAPGGTPAPASTPAPSVADFDQAFSAAASPGIRRVWELAEPGLPAQVEPFSFVSAGLLRHVRQAADLGPGQTLADLGCGRGGPGLWLARDAGASLVGVEPIPACRSPTPWPRITRTGSTGWSCPKPRSRAFLRRRRCCCPRRSTPGSGTWPSTSSRRSTNSGHWVAEQATGEMLAALTAFLAPYREAHDPSAHAAGV